jgi:hypothetical protein
MLYRIFIIAGVLLIGSGLAGYGQLVQETNDVNNAYALGSYFYKSRDYLNAYKFLLIYKYAHLDELSKPAKKNAVNELNAAILYCETQLKSGLMGGQLFNGRGYDATEKDTIKQKAQKLPPGLPAKL